MGEVSFDESVLELARERLGQLRSALASSTPFRTLTQLVEALAEIESGYERARLNLLGLHRRGMATPSDYASFESLRKNVFETQKKTVQLVRSVFEGHPSAQAQIPGPQKPPPLGAPAAPTDTASSMRGLGNPAAAVPPAAAAAIPAWMVGTIILTILGGLIAAIIVGGFVIVATLIVGGVAAESIRDVWVTRAQLEAHNQAREARLRAYEQCRSEGGSIEACRLMAEHVAPEPPPPDLGSGSWVPWLVGGLAALALAGGGLYLIGRLSGRSAGQSVDYDLSGTPRYREMDRDEFAHGEDKYDLLVGDDR